MTSTATASSVLFIAGLGRSGSTLLGDLLGSLPGVVHVGELRYIWEHGLTRDDLCGCGERFSVCPFWRMVLREAFGHRRPDPRKMLRARSRRPGNRALLLRSPAPAADEYTRALGSLLDAVRTVSDADLVVDSSKSPSHGVDLLDAGTRLRTLHLVRDPRPVVHAWRSTKARTDAAGSMQRLPAAAVIGRWWLWNLLIERRLRRRSERWARLRYEDLVAAPSASLEDLRDTLDLPGPAPRIQPDGHVRLAVSHTVWGNPARLHDGETRIRADDSWRHRMASPLRLGTTLATAPLLLRYGYLAAAGASSKKR